MNFMENDGWESVRVWVSVVIIANMQIDIAFV